jgi:hypothetical protein
MKDYVVLVTGSRTWTDVMFVRDMLDAEYNAAPAGVRLVVRHGDCPAGADHIAKIWAATLRASGAEVADDPYPANWRDFNRGAGFIRNRSMVDAGADVCLAFIRNRSAGATNCATLAYEAGIPTKVHRWEEVMAR